jgi:hypothetical protein
MALTTGTLTVANGSVTLVKRPEAARGGLS